MMVDEVNSFERTEFAILDFFFKLREKQPSLDHLIDELKNKRVKFERQGDSFWGAVEKVGQAATTYHVFVTRDDLTVFRGVLHDSKHRVAYYNDVEANNFYERLKIETSSG